LNNTYLPDTIIKAYCIGVIGISLLFTGCNTNEKSNRELTLDINSDESEAIHLFYISRDGQQVISEQWSDDFSNLIASAEIPWQIAGSPDGGLQTDLADSPILQAASDQSSFVIRTFVPQPFSGLGPEEENSSGASYLYWFKSATGEFRELYCAKGDSIINNFLYIPGESTVYFELIHQSENTLYKLDISFPLREPKVLFRGTNKIFRLRYDNASATFYAIMQTGEEIIELSQTKASDTLQTRIAGKTPAFQSSLPVSSSNGTCLVCPLLSGSRQKAYSLKIYCNNLPEQTIFLPDKIITSELIEPDNWLVIGSESIFLLDSQGKIIYRYCTPEPSLLAIDQSEYYVRSGDFTLRFRNELANPDTLPGEIHERFFDLLGVKKGVSSRKRI